MERRFLLHLKSVNKIITEKEAIENALQQENEGVKPHYCYYDYKNNMHFTPAGWLIWSTFEDGCGVVYRRSDGKMVVVTGWQGEFCFIE